jgi:hypothetical protein
MHRTFHSLACAIMTTRFNIQVNIRRLAPTAALATLLVVIVTGCGGGGGSGSSSSTEASNAGAPASSAQTTTASLGPSSGEVVARVGSVPITKAQVNHWMATVAGGDYYELSGGHAVPEGLASDPPRFGLCVERLEATAAAAPRKRYAPTGVQFLTKCRQLYQGLRAQAAALLVAIEFVFGLAEEEGITVSDAEVLAADKRSNAERFHSQAQLNRDRAAKRASVADDLLLVKQNLVSQKLLAKLKVHGHELAKLLALAEATWKQKTTCRPGYVVEHCKEFKGAPPPSPSSPAPSVLMEQVAALATGHCTNLPACGKF